MFNLLVIKNVCIAKILRKYTSNLLENKQKSKKSEEFDEKKCYYPHFSTL